MIELIFATNNLHKIQEVQAAAGEHIRIITLQQAGISIDIPEPHPTLEANAFEKSKTIHGISGMNCFSEDTGLEVEALFGEPGVKSARYAGGNRSDAGNIQKLLHNLSDSENRKARFRTVISLILEGEERIFEGICEGTIAREPQGSNGFGYDPVFRPVSSTLTFAQMDLEQKGSYSHRGKALGKLVAFLQQFDSCSYKDNEKHKE